MEIKYDENDYSVTENVIFCEPISKSIDIDDKKK